MPQNRGRVAVSGPGLRSDVRRADSYTQAGLPTKKHWTMTKPLTGTGSLERSTPTTTKGGGWRRHIPPHLVPWQGRLRQCVFGVPSRDPRKLTRLPV